MSGRIAGFIRRHRRAEEATAEAIGLNLLWVALRRLGVIGATAAAAAIVTTASETHTSHPTYSLSTKGAAFIARYEGLRLDPYNDPFNCTVGVGHLIHMGRCSSSDLSRWRISYRQAMTLLMHDAGTAEAHVRSSVTHPISQPQFDALVDLTFNIGGGGLALSSALRNVNAGAFAAVPNALRVWSYANGRFLPGLYTRRLAEGVLFSRGYYGPGIGYYNPPKPTPPANPRRVPSPVPAWAWRWVAWELGRKPYRGHAADPHYRPHAAPRRIPAWGWVFLARFTRTAR